MNRRGVAQQGRDVGSPLRGSKGVKDGFEGRAVGGKTINEAVKRAGIPPVEGVALNGFRQDPWVPQRRKPSRESED